MKIQAVIPICKNTDKYARPHSWKGQGRGVDFGQHLSKDGVKVVVIVTENGNAFVKDWNPTPEEILESWELVDTKTLWKEK
jgi:hypothetical protein